MNAPAAIAAIGHNAGPALDPVSDVLAPFDDAIAEAAQWLDGQRVEDERAMKAADALAADIRRARVALKAARDAATAPLHDAWKAEVARWKPSEDDLERVQKGLAALVDGFKRKLAEERAAAAEAARQEADRARQEAEQARRAADAADIDSQRQAAAATHATRQAEIAARQAAKAVPKGLRTVARYEVTNLTDFLRWINAHDRPALERFADDYARRVHTDRMTRPGLRVWTEKQAF